MDDALLGLPDLGLQLLRNDLRLLERRLRDERFARELYGLLASARLYKDGEIVAADPRLARDLVNGARGGEPLALSHRFREEGIDDDVRVELERLGWRVRPVQVESEAGERTADG